ncbi:uncharacterized protein DS421_18g610790 [Arachis hypogaea]|nr:uncharacterized protein DS421_18g610790 [Arachis hypogaea]
MPSTTISTFTSTTKFNTEAEIQHKFNKSRNQKFNKSTQIQRIQQPNQHTTTIKLENNKSKSKAKAVTKVEAEAVIEAEAEEKEEEETDAELSALGHPSLAAAAERARTGDALHPQIPLSPRPPITTRPTTEHAQTSSASDPPLSPSRAALLALGSSSRRRTPRRQKHA